MESVLNKRPVRTGKIWLTVSVCVFIFVYVIILNTVSKISLGDIVLFLASQAVFVLLPGMCLLLYINPPKSCANYLIVSYMLGIGIMILQAFLYAALHLTSQSLIGMAAVSAVSVWGIYRKRDLFFNIFRDGNSKDGFSLLCLIAALLIICAVFGTAIYKTPDLMPGGVSYLYLDLLWNAGNTVSFANGLPVGDIHVSGFTFGYHYFVNAFLAPFFNTLNISAFDLYIKLLPTVGGIALCGGFYILFGSLIKSRALAAALSFVCLLCMDSVFSEILWYVYSSPICIGICAAAVYYFIKLFGNFEKAKISDPDFIVFLLLLTIATGTKTLLAVPLIAGAGITILAQIIIKRSNIKNMLIMGIVILLSVAAIYLVFVYGTHAFNAFSRAFFSLMWIEGDPWYYTAALAAFPNLPEIAVKAICYPVYLIITYPLIVAALIALLVCLVKKKGGFYIPLFLFSGILTGLAAASVTYQVGSSNIYFILGALPLCLYALLYIIDACRVNRAAKTSLIIITCAVLAYSSCSALSSLYNNYTEGLPSRSANGGGSPYDTINSGEYEGMLWLRENTERGDIIASDRQYYAPEESLNYARYYYYTAFSERPNYLEGFNYISTHTPDYEEVLTDKLRVLNRAYQNDSEAFKDLYDEGVKYLVATRFVHPDFVLNGEFGTEVFSNGDITIYRLKD